MDQQKFESVNLCMRWYEGHKRNLFPSWIKPSDAEPAPLLVYKWCNGLNRQENIWRTDDGDCVVLMQSKFDQMFMKIDLTLLNR